MSRNTILLYLAIKYEGDWEKIYAAIKRKEPIADGDLEALEKEYQGHYFTLMDDFYPKNLSNSFRPPIVVFYKGDIELLKRDRILAVVGSRVPSHYGEFATNKLIGELSKDIVIISGLAKGIDAIAHQAALDNDLKTIAVLGNGIDYIYPSENAGLYKKILDNGGLLLSEYPGLVKPEKPHFPVRNRIIAALSKGILVPEAGEKSGTSITVSYGLEFGKTIMCVPNPIEEDRQSFPNELLKHGACCVTKGSDIEGEI